MALIAHFEHHLKNLACSADIAYEGLSGKITVTKNKSLDYYQNLLTFSDTKVDIMHSISCKLRIVKKLSDTFYINHIMTLTRVLLEYEF